MTLDNIVLTDDELVALSFERGRPWPTPLPTVDSSQRDALEMAALRGLRSLALRGALVDGEFLPTVEEVANVTVARPGLLLHRGDDIGEVEGGANLGLAIVALSGVWLLDDVSWAGTHRLRRADSTQELLDFLVSSLEENAWGSTHGTTTCLTSWSTVETRTLVVGAGNPYVISRTLDISTDSLTVPVRTWVDGALKDASVTGN
jgi:hypothetical protein